MSLHLVALVLALPMWAQAIAMPAVSRVQYVDALPAGIVGYAYTTSEGEILITPACRTSDEILMQCLVHEGRHLQGHGECLGYVSQLVLAWELQQSDAAIIWVRNLYLRYGEPACLLNDVEGYDKY